MGNWDKYVSVATAAWQPSRLGLKLPFSSENLSWLRFGVDGQRDFVKSFLVLCEVRRFSVSVWPRLKSSAYSHSIIRRSLLALKNSFSCMACFRRKLPVFHTKSSLALITKWFDNMSEADYKAEFNLGLQREISLFWLRPYRFRHHL